MGWKVYDGIFSCLQIVEFTGSLLQHVNMKHNNQFYWHVKSFHLTIYWQVDVLYFNPTIFHNLWTSLQNNKSGKHTPCLKCHVHSKPTGLRRVYMGIGSLVCIVNLVIAPVANVLMRLGCQGKGTEDFSRQWLFFKPGNYHRKSHTCAW